MDTKSGRCKLVCTCLVLATVMMIAQTSQARPVTALGAFQETSVGQIAQGYGDFPRLPVVAAGADGSTLALYMVEHDRAMLLLEFKGLNKDSDIITAQLSPDGRHIALLLCTSDGDSTLEVVHAEGTGYATLDQGVGSLAQEKGAASEKITGLAWLDNEHIVYSKVTMPSTEEFYSNWDKGTPLPVRGEVWVVDLAGRAQPLADDLPVERVLGASLDGQHIYATCYPDPERERFGGEGFCVLDVDSRILRVLWPSPERPLVGSSVYNDTLAGFSLVTMPDGALQVVFSTTEAHDGPRDAPPDVWLADPESGETEHIWIARGDTTTKRTHGYDGVSAFLWSPHSERVFAYLPGGWTDAGPWLVDLQSGESRGLTDAGRLLAWEPEGIVIQQTGVVQLLGELGELLGEVHIPEELRGPLWVPNEVVNRDVPYVHQLWDTPDWWDVPGRWGGEWSCGPTSAVMALAYFGQLQRHPITVYKPVQAHTSDFGWYVTTDYCPYPFDQCAGYTHVSAGEGTNSFNVASPYKAPLSTNKVAGAHGACVNAYGSAVAADIQTYARKHDVGSYVETSPTELRVKTELDGGAIVLLDTYLPGVGLGHIVVIRGYTSDNPTQYIVNDPYGWKPIDGVYDTCEENPSIHCGQEVVYTWAQMDPQWYVALYGPQYLPDLHKTSTWDGTITLKNGAGLSGWVATDTIYFMNQNGSLSTYCTSPTIQPNGTWTARLSDILGSDFTGTGVVVPRQTALSAVVVHTDPQRAAAYTSLRPTGTDADSNWEMVGTDVYASPIYKHDAWQYTSSISVMNTGSQQTTVRVRYYNLGGDLVGSAQSYTLAPFASHVFVPSGVGNAFFGSARIDQTSSQKQPLAVVADSLKNDGKVDFNSTAQRGAPVVWLPHLSKNYYGWRSCFTVRNLSTTQSAEVNVTYYWAGGSYTDAAFVTLNPRGMANMCQDNPRYAGLSNIPFSAKVWTTGGQSIAVTVNEDYTTSPERHMSYSSVAQPSTTVILPYLLKNASALGGNWISGLMVQNTGTQATTMQIRYYNADGSLALGPVNSSPISAGSYWSIYLGNVGLLDNWWGSAVVTADQPLAAEGNATCTNCSGDTTYAYNGVNR